MEWQAIISLLLSGAMFVIAMVTLTRNGRKDRKSEYIEETKKIDSIKEALTKANVKLDTICTTMTETRTDIKVMNEDINAVANRVSLIENEMKTVWSRIDELRAKVGHYHEGE